MVLYFLVFCIISLQRARLLLFHGDPMILPWLRKFDHSPFRHPKQSPAAMCATFKAWVGRGQLQPIVQLHWSLHWLDRSLCHVLIVTRGAHMATPLRWRIVDAGVAWNKGFAAFEFLFDY